MPPLVQTLLHSSSRPNGIAQATSSKAQPPKDSASFQRTFERAAQDENVPVEKPAARVEPTSSAPVQSAPSDDAESQVSDAPKPQAAELPETEVPAEVCGCEQSVVQTAANPAPTVNVETAGLTLNLQPITLTTPTTENAPAQPVQPMALQPNATPSIQTAPAETQLKPPTSEWMNFQQAQMSDANTATPQARTSASIDSELPPPVSTAQIRQSGALKENASIQPQNDAKNEPSPQSTPGEPNRTSVKSDAVVVSRIAGSHGRSEEIPAAARAAKVDTAVRLENLGHMTLDARPTQTSATPAMNLGQQSALSLAGPGMNATANDVLRFGTMSSEEPSPPMAHQVSRGLSALVNQRGGQLTMRLDPPELGALRVQMTLSRGSVSADFQATTPQAQNLLEKNLAALKQTLESQGLQVDRLTVHTSTTNGNGSMRHESGTDSQSRQQHDAAGGQSRGRRDGDPQQQQREFPMHEFARFANEMNQ